MTMDPFSDVNSKVSSEDKSSIVREEENEEESDTDRSSEVEDDRTGFAAQLRKHRKQVLEKDAAASGFADALRKHRELFNLEHAEDEVVGGEGITNTIYNGVDMLNGGNSSLIPPEGDEMNGTQSNESFFDSLGGIVEEKYDDESAGCGTVQSRAKIKENGGDDPLIDFGTTPQFPEETVNEVGNNNFGDFDERQMHTTESLEENGGGDVIFDNGKATPSQSEPTVDQIVNDDNAEVIGNGDDAVSSHYGDLDDSEALVIKTQLQKSEERVPIKMSCDLDEDYFGDFGEAQTSVYNFEDFGDVPSMPSQTDLIDTDQDDAFENFGCMSLQSNPTAKMIENDDNDFGDFGTASILPPLTPGEDNNQNDTLGEFGAPSSYLGDFDAVLSEPEPPNNPNENNHDSYDDDFGDVGAVQLQTEESDSAIDRDDDGNDFGDFGAATCPSQPEPSKTMSEDNDDDGGDDFGDFGAAPSPSQPEPSKTTSNDNDDNEFGEFGATTSQPDPSGTMSTDNNDNDDTDGLGALGAAPSHPEPSKTMSDDNQDDDDDDGFGNFGAAPSSSQHESLKTMIEDNGDDDFGDFGAAHSPSQPEPSKTMSEDNQDDDFGDFGAAPSPSQPEPTMSGDNQINDDDDFGDSGAVTSPSQPESSKTMSEDNYDDDFGDFGAANSPSQPEPTMSGDNEDNDDDDFGDFGAANSPSQPKPSKTMNQDSQNNDDDDFGDFGAAPSQPETSNNDADHDGDDDDFGDFGAAPSPSQPEPSKNTSEDNEDNDDDDFGDFGAAASQPETSNNANDDDDDFGDFVLTPKDYDEDNIHGDGFGDFNGVTSDSNDSMNAPESVAPLAPIGKISDRTRNIFAKMQTFHTFSDLRHHESTNDNASCERESLSKFFASKKLEDCHEKNLLDGLLMGAPKPTDYRFSPIFNEDGRGFYDCFVYPLNGLRPPRDEFPNEKQLRRKSSIRAIPDVLPIRLPSGKEMPLHTASPRNGRLPKSMSEEPIEAVELPNLNVGNVADDSSGIVARFRLKIPDLNFMLQSKLTLPTN
eukprot:jgi/Psemu1/327331/estExt_fgenesh1_pg.C_6220002